MRTPRLPVVDWTDAPRRFKWVRPFRRKTKSSFCACAITFQLASTTKFLNCLPFTVPTVSLSYCLPILVFNSFHKETIMHGHDRHNTIVLSVMDNMSTTCFGQYYYWPSSSWIQLSEKTAQYIIWYSITIIVGIVEGDEISFTKELEVVCAEALICRYAYYLYISTY